MAAQAAMTMGVNQVAKRETRDSIGDCLEIACAHASKNWHPYTCENLCKRKQIQLSNHM